MCFVKIRAGKFVLFTRGVNGITFMCKPCNRTEFGQYRTSWQVPSATSEIRLLAVGV